jgi:Putative Flp pilus-assembly TadE/G-like
MGIARQRQRGQVLIMFALSSVALLATIGLLYTFGLVLAERRTLQTAADAASLAGSWQVVSELQSDTLSQASVYGIVQSYLSSNGATAFDVFYVDASGAQLSAVQASGTFDFHARGVRVTARAQVPKVLPGFVGGGIVQVEATGSATARPNLPPTSETLVVPLAVFVDDARAAYTAHVQYDLFHPTTTPIGQPLTIDYLDPSTLPATGATDYGADDINLQFWSDGQHSNGTLQSSSVVALIGNPHQASVAAGLLDNIRRQGLGYALISVPIWSSSPSDDTLQLSGFARMKIKASDISASTARGVFVPYTTAAYGPVSAPSPDLGAAVIGMVP